MEDDDGGFARPRLVVGNRVAQRFARSVAVARRRRLISVHREWNESTEWWVGQVHAETEVYRIGSFASPEQAVAATIRGYYEIASSIHREEMQQTRMPREGMQREAIQRDGMRRDGMQREGMQGEGMERGSALPRKARRAARRGVPRADGASTSDH